MRQRRCRHFLGFHWDRLSTKEMFLIENPARRCHVHEAIRHARLMVFMRTSTCAATSRSTNGFQI